MTRSDHHDVPSQASVTGPSGELLTVADVCTWFNVPKSWVYDEVEANRLPYIRLGRTQLRFARADLERYLHERRRA